MIKNKGLNKKVDFNYLKKESKEEFLLNTTNIVDMYIFNLNDKEYYLVNFCNESLDETIIKITKSIFVYLKSQEIK